jgi:Mn2+/Fe2+ NRAMP family transporter
MSSVLELFLGIMSALGGFVDIGELVFAIQGGAKFGYALLWVVVLGTIGIILYAEMAGRIAAVRRTATFEVIREVMGESRGFPVLVASNLVNLLTCAAEIGGIAIVMQMLFGGDYRLMIVAGAGLLLLIVYSLKLAWLERLFGLLGLGLLAYAWVAISLGPDWKEAMRGLVPGPPPAASPGTLVYLYFIVGIFSSVLMPYEIYFYSSGAIEDKWTPKDLRMNFLNSVVGFTLGCLLVLALIVVGAQVFQPNALDSQLLSSTLLPPIVALGVKGLLVALLGMLFAIGGAAAETALSGAYNFCQFFGHPWSKDRKAREVPVFTLLWMGIVLAGMAIAMSGVNPVKIVELSVIFAVVVLPFTYYPVLRTASDRKLMGEHVNNRFITVMGWIYFALIVAAAASAIPLMVLTHMGDG